MHDLPAWCEATYYDLCKEYPKLAPLVSDGRRALTAPQLAASDALRTKLNEIIESEEADSPTIPVATASTAVMEFYRLSYSAAKEQNAIRQETINQTTGAFSLA